MLKKIKCLLLTVLSLGVVGCNSTTNTSNEDDKLKITLVLDEGGVNDQSFNESAWTGALAAKEKYNVEVSYIESKQESEYLQNVETAIDDSDLVIGVGYKFTEAIKEVSEAYTEQKFVLIDGNWEGMPDNVTSIMFSEEDAGYSVGLVASQMTNTNKLGFIGGFDIPSVTNFKIGFEKALKEVDTDVQLITQYANSFTDAAKGRVMAEQMVNNGVDIIFTAGGSVNSGVFEVMTEKNLMAIGVDMASNYIAPQTIITSALKNVNVGVETIIGELVNNSLEGGVIKEFNLKNNGVGFEKTNLLSDEIIKYVENRIQ